MLFRSHRTKEVKKKKKDESKGETQERRKQDKLMLREKVASLDMYFLNKHGTIYDEKIKGR